MHDFPTEEGPAMTTLTVISLPPITSFFSSEMGCFLLADFGFVDFSSVSGGLVFATGSRVFRIAGRNFNFSSSVNPKT